MIDGLEGMIYDGLWMGIKNFFSMIFGNPKILIALSAVIILIIISNLLKSKKK